MHIGFRTSGGRGEYEVVGSHSGYSAASLEGWSFFVLWPDDIVRDTGLWLDPGGSKKPRLRSMSSPPIQIGRIFASALLLPDPTRSFQDTPSDTPVTRAKAYTITQVGFGPSSEFAEFAERVTFVPSWIELSNQGASEAVGVDIRWRRIEAVFARRDNLPRTLGDLLTAHRNRLSAGSAVDKGLTLIVEQICRYLLWVEGVHYVDGHDPLPALERLADISPSHGPFLPSPEELSEDEPQISARAAFEYRMTKVRGFNARKFRREVKLAYRNRCAFCGIELGDIDGVPSGIDAAHILAWSKHDLDVVSNGIALCKLHHWAFDASLLLPVLTGQDYVLRFTTLAERIDTSSLQKICEDGLVIPKEWLPVDIAQRPNPHFLQKLQADLGLTLRSDWLEL